MTPGRCSRPSPCEPVLTTEPRERPLIATEPLMLPCNLRDDHVVSSLPLKSPPRLPHCTPSRWPCFQIHWDRGSHRKHSSPHLTRCSHPPPATALRRADSPAAVRKEPAVLLADILPSLSCTNLLSLSAPSFPSANKDAVSRLTKHPKQIKTNKQKNTLVPESPSSFHSTSSQESFTFVISKSSPSIPSGIPRTPSNAFYQDHSERPMVLVVGA